MSHYAWELTKDNAIDVLVSRLVVGAVEDSVGAKNDSDVVTRGVWDWASADVVRWTSDRRRQ
jgi:hypothetical protein